MPEAFIELLYVAYINLHSGMSETKDSMLCSSEGETLCVRSTIILRIGVFNCWVCGSRQTIIAIIALTLLRCNDHSK